MKILETERLNLRELRTADDAEFVYALLNTPKFIKYIGDRGVRSAQDAANFIENRYRLSYRDNGFGLYVVERKSDGVSVGLCGFVKRDTLPGPDVGFAFLPEFEGLGYGFESADAVMKYG
ncbi:MAG TPA: GNAT family N-acetyltransferase, partial [Pyrinomonadaceae bacterium]|nr:GNAT family N-acetyltransferase [Pyrinomonadaceae bacterium]